MRKFLSAFLIAVICITAPVNYCSAATTYSLNEFSDYSSAHKFPASNSLGAYFYGFKSQTLQVAVVLPEFKLRSVDIGADITAACQSGDRTYTLSAVNRAKNAYKISELNNKTGEVKHYEYTLSIYYSKNQISVTDGKYFFIKSDSYYAYVVSASLGSSNEIRYDFDEHNVNQLINNDGKTYALLDNCELYRLSNGQAEYITTVDNGCSLYDAGIDRLLSTTGKLYSLSDGSSIKANTNKAYLANITGDNHFYSDGNGIKKTLLSSPFEFSSAELSSKPEYIVAYKDKSAVICDDCSCFVLTSKDYTDFEALYNTPSTTADTPPSEEASYKIKDGQISGIKSGTTVSSFKKEFSENAVIKSADGDTVTSGKIKTGQILVLDGKCYSISVLGDITGEGNVKSNDVACAAEYLLGSKQLDEVCKTAADYNMDGKIDNKDVVLISRTANGIT